METVNKARFDEEEKHILCRHSTMRSADAQLIHHLAMLPDNGVRSLVLNCVVRAYHGFNPSNSVHIILIARDKTHTRSWAGQQT